MRCINSCCILPGNGGTTKIQWEMTRLGHLFGRNKGHGAYFGIQLNFVQMILIDFDYRHYATTPMSCPFLPSHDCNLLTSLDGFSSPNPKIPTRHVFFFVICFKAETMLESIHNKQTTYTVTYMCPLFAMQNGSLIDDSQMIMMIYLLICQKWCFSRANC